MKAEKNIIINGGVFAMVITCQSIFLFLDFIWSDHYLNILTIYQILINWIQLLESSKSSDSKIN